MTLSDLELGWALRRMEEAEVALAQARSSPDSLRKYFVVKAILAGRQSLAQILGIADVDRRALVRVAENTPSEGVDLIKAFDDIVGFLQANEVDSGTLLNLGDILLSAARTTVTSIEDFECREGD